MLVIIAVMIMAFMMTVAFSVDVAYMHLVRSELRTATDAASKAASQALVRTSDRNAAIAAAQSIAREHTISGRPLELRASEVQFGHAEPNNSGMFDFTPGGTPTNSIRVNGRRTADSLGGAVPLHFGRLFSVNAFQPQHFSTTTFVERDVVLVVDRSGSMAGQKFQDLKNAVAAFVTVLEQNNTVDERVGLASYASDATQDVQLTTDLTQINRGMNRLLANGFTSISAGINAGQQVMTGSRSPEFVERTMIVMTDGIHNTGPAPETSAQNVVNAGVVLHTISFGSDADRGRMQRMAQLGRGRYFHASNGTDLSEAFREIARTLNSIMTE
ncbi:MAG: VWA domain-containing protein [Pirellulaceae bacterium]|nr:VWA domain-containing protein [Pirellulaceae bacterium]